MNLNNIKLGAVSIEGQNTARGGFFGTAEGNEGKWENKDIIG